MSLFILAQGFTAFGQTGKVVKLEYDYLNSKTFLVHLDVLRPCSADSLSPTYSIAFRNPSTGNTVTGKVELQSVNTVSFYCRSAVPGCQVPNSPGQGQGTEILRYSDTFRFDSGTLKTLLGSSCAVEAWAMGNRDSSNTAGIQLAVFTSWNVCLETTSSLKVEHTLPGTVYEDRTIRFAPSITKANARDSLVITRESALDSFSSIATYLSGFGSNQPFTSFCIPNTSCTPKPGNNPPEGVYFDSRQGYFVAMPTTFGQVASLVYKYHWYRRVNGKMEWIGTMHHESEFTVIRGGGNTPEIQVNNQDALFHQKPFLLGKRGCFDVSITDLDNNNSGADTNQLFFTNVISNTTFRWLDSTAKSKIGRFCFTPDTNQVGQLLLANFMAVDDHCALPERSSINVVLKADSLRIRGRVSEVSRCQEVTLKFQYTSSEFLPLNYRWTVNGKLAGSEDSISFTASSTGNIPYSLRVTSLLSSDTLLIQDSVTITSILEAKPGIEPAYCKGNSVILKPTITGGTSPYTIQWNGLVADSFSWVANSDSALAVQITDVQGCRIEFRDTLRVSTAELLLTGPDQVCQNGAVFELTGTPITGSWGNTGNVKLVEPDTLSVGVNNLIFQYIDSLQCVFTKAKSVLVLASPKVPLDSINLCRGKDQVLPRNDKGEWSGVGVNDNVFYSDAVDPGLYKIQYVASKLNGCSVDDSIHVRVKAIPVVSMDPVGSICKNSKPIVIRFEPKAAALTGPNTLDSMFSPNSNLPDTVQLRIDYSAPNGCAGSDSTQIVFKATPKANFEGDPLWGDFPLNVSFNNLSIGGGTWFWNFGDPGSGASNFSNQRHATHTYAFNGTYDVSLAATDPFSGCSDTLIKEGMIKATAGLSELEKTGFQVTPIPFQDVLRLDLASDAQITIYSGTGKNVFSQHVGRGRTEVLTQHWNAGVYFVLYTDDQHMVRKKILKAR